MTGMDDLVTWLRAQLHEDERKVAAMTREAERARTAPIFANHPPNWLAGVDIFVSPARWQDEVDAKRRILAEHVEGSVADGAPTGTCRSCDNYAVPCPTVRLLALPYASRDGYRSGWRP
jgi:hypothetical protein